MMPSRLEEIQAGGAKMYMHLNFGHGYGYQYSCVAEPRIHIVMYNPKKRNDPKHPAYKDFVVKGDPTDARYKTLEEAVLAVDKLDQAKAIDAEWDAAAPKGKPAAIEGMLP